MNRRRYLAGTGSVVAVGTAGGYAVGRASGDDEDDAESTAEESDQETTDGEETADGDEETPIRTILHLTSGDEADHDRALSNLENLLADETTDNDAVQFVVNSAAIWVYVEGETEYADRIRALAEDGVEFNGCENSLEGYGIDESELLEPVTVVPSGVGEIAKRQAEGYGYIKVP